METDIDGICVKCIYFLPLEDVDVCLAEPHSEDMTSDQNGVIIQCKRFYQNNEITENNDTENSSYQS
jgi:hypothetical protein